MWTGYDRAAIEAELGKGVTWVEEEDSRDMCFLMDNSISQGITHEEQIHYDALQALYCSGR